MTIGDGMFWLGFWFVGCPMILLFIGLVCACCAGLVEWCGNRTNMSKVNRQAERLKARIRAPGPKDWDAIKNDVERFSHGELTDA